MNSELEIKKEIFELRIIRYKDYSKEQFKLEFDSLNLIEQIEEYLIIIDELKFIDDFFCKFESVAFRKVNISDVEGWFEILQDYKKDKQAFIEKLPKWKNKAFNTDRLNLLNNYEYVISFLPKNFTNIVEEYIRYKNNLLKLFFTDTFVILQEIISKDNIFYYKLNNNKLLKCEEYKSIELVLSFKEIVEKQEMLKSTLSEEININIILLVVDNTNKDIESIKITKKLLYNNKALCVKIKGDRDILENFNKNLKIKIESDEMEKRLMSLRRDITLKHLIND